MKLYVCYTSKELHLPRPGGHPCANAFEALRIAGYEPEVIRSYGFGGMPGALQTGRRKRVKEQTGSYWVPALETDSGEWIGGSEQIVGWAERHPAGD